MARPKKIGLDYFPMDVTFDEKIQSLETLYGNDGLIWIIKFWQTAYRNENGEVNLSKYFGEVLAKNCRITTDKQQEIINFSLEIHLIQKTDKPDTYTSNGIQKRISEVFKERAKALKRYHQKKEIKVKINRKESKGKVSPYTSSKYFIIPTIEEIKTYCDERKNGIDANHFFDFYQSKNWMIGKNKMKDWKAAVRTWEQNNKNITPPHPYEKL